MNDIKCRRCNIANPKGRTDNIDRNCYDKNNCSSIYFDLAYRMMAYFNERYTKEEGYFITRSGILHLYWGKCGWRWEYIYPIDISSWNIPILVDTTNPLTRNK